MKRLIVVGLMGSLMALTQTTLAEEKSQYHLFNSVPRELMREMSTDRPDKTESAYTVDAGHIQVETSFVDYTYDHRNPQGVDDRVDNLSVMPTNLKFGLLNNMDIQFVVEPHIEEKTTIDRAREKKRGFGDLQTRLKVNIWGNDGGQTALAVMPFVKFPTATDDLGNNTYEGGVIIPLAVALPGDWGMGIMTEFDFNRDEQKEFYTEYINSITFSHSIVGELGGYVEFFSSFNDEEGTDWVGTADMGLTYAVTDDIQLDGGVNIGVTRSADDFNPFLGCSIRY